MIGGRSALLTAAGGGNPYGNWTGNYSNVSLLLRNRTPSGILIPLDESPTPKTIARFGNASNTTAVVKYGTSAMAFDGSGDYFEAPATTDFNFDNNPFTIEAWINASVLTSFAGIISVMNNGSASTLAGYVFHVDVDGSLSFRDYSNGAQQFVLSSAAGVITTGQWYHVAVCKEGTGTNQVRLFVDGTIVASGTRNANIPVGTSGQPARIGAWRYPPEPRFFNGYIDDLRITKGFARYTGNFTPPTAELPANINDDPSYNSVSLLLRNGTPTTVLIPLDESPSPNALTAAGNAQNTTAVVKYGTSSMAFDGSNSVISTPYNTAFNLAGLDYTIEMWLRQTASSVGSVGQVPLVYSDFSNAGVPQGWRLHTDNEFVYLYFNSAIQLQSSTGLTLNTWQHLAICRSGSTTRMFLDGVQVGSTTSATFTDPSSSATLRIGAFAFSEYYFPFNGYIDDLRITKGVARYTANFTAPTAELPANITDDPSYNSVSLLLRNGTPKLIPLDESPSPKEVTTAGTAGLSTLIKKYGTSSMVFDGSNSNITTPYNTAFDLAGVDFTIEMWIRLNSADGFPTPLSYGQGVGGGYRISLVSGAPHWYINSSSAIISSASLTLNTWQHLAICRSGSTTRLFIDGTQRGSTTETFTDPARGANLRIGALVDNPSFYFPLNGYIDDLRITKGFARYTKNFLPPPAELPAI